MNQFHYDFINGRNERILQSILTENEIQILKPSRPGLRIRFLFLISDILFGLSEWVRPDELRIFVSDRGLDDCSPYANCT